MKVNVIEYRGIIVKEIDSLHTEGLREFKHYVVMVSDDGIDKT